MLSGYKTIIIAVIYILLSTFTGLTGWVVPGFTPDANWLAHDLAGAVVVSGRMGLSSGMQRLLAMLLDSLAPKIIAGVKDAINKP